MMLDRNGHGPICGDHFFFYRKIVLLGDIKSKPINPAGVTYGGLKGAYQA